jgi:hypothetical protein
MQSLIAHTVPCSKHLFSRFDVDEVFLLIGCELTFVTSVSKHLGIAFYP